MCKDIVLTISFFLLFNFIFAQKIKKDSIKTNHLDEVVITGQYSKQSVKKSVFDVTVINRKTIEQNAANNLADLLNQTLNIRITPNASEGKSAISLFGLDGQYFKILQDGIPMVSEDGFGNNIDLTQVNLENVKQIEIVEGSMGVSYGANAVSGIINIITKTGSKDTWNISVAIQEETAGNEYEWWNKGRHIQNFNIAHNINENLYVNATISRDHFTGFLNDRGGKNHFLLDGKRGHEWLPKEQLTTNGVVRYAKNNFSITYKMGFYKSLLNRYDKKIEERNNALTGEVDIIAPEDKDFVTNRMTHDIVVNTKIKNKLNFNFYAAYQEQTKKVRRVIYDLHTRESDKASYKDYLFRKTYFSKATINNFTTNKSYDFEVGLEFNAEDGFGSAVSSIINTVDISEKLSNFDVFVTSEYEVNKNLKFKPGVRYSLQSLFKNQLQYSLSTRYLLKNNFELRNVIGSSYRTPSFDELFTYFVDSNHNVTGNENLLPERSYSIFTHLKKATYFKNGKLINKLKFGFVNVKDKIDLAVSATEPILAYQYLNVNNHRSLDYSLENSLHYKDVRFQLNTTLLGIAQYLNNPQDINDYVYTFLFNSSLGYNVAKINTNFLVTYKYNGEQFGYVLDTNDEYIKNKLDSYSWLDASVKTTFFKNKLETTIGARNLTNVTRVQSSVSNNSGGQHATNTGSFLLGYGRSYFVKLKYNLDI